jgi:type II secretory pathway pseudopilin PulG
MKSGNIRRTESAVSRTRRHRGFTLMGTMVVIAILGILGALIVQRISSGPNEAPKSQPNKTSAWARGQ